MSRLAKLIKKGFVLGLFLFLSIIVLHFYIVSSTKKYIYTSKNKIDASYTGIVLGAKVYKNGQLSGILKDRVDSAFELYKAKKIKRFLLSGDHGKTDYDEVNRMKKYLIDKGVPTDAIFLDHAGFDTYDSMYRAKEIFEIDDVIIITQKFHVKRAVYIANTLGLHAQGYIADKHIYGIGKRMFIREKLANVKAFFEILFHRKPKFLGTKIPITGSSSKSYD